MTGGQGIAGGGGGGGWRGQAARLSVRGRRRRRRKMTRTGTIMMTMTMTSCYVVFCTFERCCSTALTGPFQVPVHHIAQGWTTSRLLDPVQQQSLELKCKYRQTRIVIAGLRQHVPESVVSPKEKVFQGSRRAPRIAKRLRPRRTDVSRALKTRRLQSALCWGS